MSEVSGIWWEEGGPPAEVDETAAHRWDQVADPGGDTVADGLRVVPALAVGGVWARILTALQALADAAGAIVWDVSVDSTIARAHQHAAGARRNPDSQSEPPGGVETEPADHALGRSRGGWTTKTHLACEQGRKLLSIVVTAGQRGDSPQFAAVVEAISVPGPGRPRNRPDCVLADKALQ
jgi:hypothetical protein